MLCSTITNIYHLLPILVIHFDDVDALVVVLSVPLSVHLSSVV